MILPGTFSKNKKCIHAIIETPKGSRNKYTFNKEGDYYQLKKILPSGTSFPLDFGFIPQTKGADGDPLDVMVISDFPCFTGCVLEARVIGVIVAEQKEKKGKPVRNDRFVAVAIESLSYDTLEEISDMNQNLLDEIIHFFEYYNDMEGKKFKFIKTGDSKSALKIIKNNLIEKE
jgi:inorganic pyrophosphatase